MVSLAKPLPKSGSPISARRNQCALGSCARSVGKSSGTASPSPVADGFGLTAASNFAVKGFVRIGDGTGDVSAIPAILESTHVRAGKT